MTTESRTAERKETPGHADDAERARRAAHLRALDRHIIAEGNAALMRGARVAAIFGVASGAAVFLLTAVGALHGVEFPGAAAFLCGGYAFFVYALARRGLIHGWVRYAVMMLFASLPTGVFAAAAIVLPGGAATYITGPYSFLYFLILVVTGFFFDFKLTMAATVAAVAGYGLMVGLSLETLRTISTGDAILTQDLSAPAIYVLRAAVLFGTGAAVGALSGVAKRLILRALAEEQEKHAISRLFGQYVSDEIKDKILREGHLLRGETKQVAILFSDIRGFTSLSEGRTPEAMVATLNGYFDHMVEAVQENGGVVDKFIGDAIMAVFGGVIDLENPCEAALRTALAMRLRLEVFNRQQRLAGGDALEIGIGIHFGEVLQGNLGSRDRKEFTVIGDAVNVASRLESATKGTAFPVLITRAVHDRLEPASRAQCHALEDITVKGKAATLAIFGVGATAPA
ncbi:MAG: adenylate/guanylate cyclase domain-containing protein [Planctomycetes bacterium]|nr:adenylate/guanylate cyclase domain-containing protein [Planctomycetota bacterium]